MFKHPFNSVPQLVDVCLWNITRTYNNKTAHNNNVEKTREKSMIVHNILINGDKSFLNVEGGLKTSTLCIN